jgi:hypothetical protein
MADWHRWAPPDPGISESATKALAGQWLASKMQAAVQTAGGVLERREVHKTAQENFLGRLRRGPSVIVPLQLSFIWRIPIVTRNASDE